MLLWENAICKLLTRLFFDIKVICNYSSIRIHCVVVWFKNLLSWRTYVLCFNKTMLFLFENNLQHSIGLPLRSLVNWNIIFWFIISLWVEQYFFFCKKWFIETKKFIFGKKKNYNISFVCICPHTTTDWMSKVIKFYAAKNDVCQGKCDINNPHISEIEQKKEHFYRKCSRK